MYCLKAGTVELILPAEGVLTVRRLACGWSQSDSVIRLQEMLLLRIVEHKGKPVVFCYRKLRSKVYESSW